MKLGVLFFIGLSIMVVGINGDVGSLLACIIDPNILQEV